MIELVAPFILEDTEERFPEEAETKASILRDDSEGDVS